jgi:hypothetical protein
MTSTFIAKTHAAFLADAAERCARASAQPSDPAAVDAAIAALAAGLVQAGSLTPADLRCVRSAAPIVAGL